MTPAVRLEQYRYRGTQVPFFCRNYSGGRGGVWPLWAVKLAPSRRGRPEG
jgi:hypothetical protein